MQDHLSPTTPTAARLAPPTTPSRPPARVSEALEWVERARGHLYELHQLLGHADLTFGEAVDALRSAGHLSLIHI